MTLTNELASLFARADLVIAADGGLSHCIAAHCWPEVLVGDLDSADPEQVAQAREAGAVVQEFDENKDETDLELALAVAIEHRPDEIVVVGVFGGRVDHALANVALVADPRWPCAVSCADGARDMWVLHGGSTPTRTLHQAPGTQMTLLAWNGDAVGVVTKGLRWPLQSETLRAGSPRGVSNVCDEPLQQVSLQSGSLLIITAQSGLVL